jgi:hypothetical protein
MSEAYAACALEKFRAAVPGPHQVDLTDGCRFDWRDFLRGKPKEAVGEGIVRFTAESLMGISDPNRQGEPRFDFVAWQVDRRVVRFHPSTHQSAKDLYGTDDEWGARALPPGLRFTADDPNGPLLTFDQAKAHNFNFDRIGSKEARMLAVRALESVAGRAGGALQPAARVDQVDLTSGEVLQWWRWVPNRGPASHVLI